MNRSDLSTKSRTDNPPSVEFVLINGYEGFTDCRQVDGGTRI